MLNIISTCRDILCVDINVDKRCVDHSTRNYTKKSFEGASCKHSGIATGGSRGQSANPDSERNAKNWGEEGKSGKK